MEAFTKKEQMAAKEKLNRAVKAGKVFKPDSCSKCKGSEKKMYGHHKDYSKPLEVEWLCSACHGITHRLSRIIKQNAKNRRRTLKEVIDWDKYLDQLSYRQREVVKLRFGFAGGRPHTLKEIGKIFNCSRERIRQIEVKALERLKFRLVA